MAACSDLEEKTSSSKETLPLKIYVEEAVSHAMRENCYSELTNISKNHETFSELTEESKTGDLTTLSDDEFLHLLKEASTFNKPNKTESVLLKQLRKEVAETEPRENVKLVDSNTSESTEHRRHSKILLCNETNPSVLNSSFNNSSHHRTLESKKKQTRNKEDTNCKSALNTDVFQKSVQQSQSLQDLLSSDSSKVRQKFQKAQRTLSLSSEEAIGIVSDSFSNTSKTGKKSNKQSSVASSNSKSELNKSNLNKANTKPPDYLGSLSITLDTDNEKRKYESNIQNDSLPYQTLINECDISMTDHRKEQVSEKRACGSPIEIEMEEIKSDKMASKDDKISSIKVGEQSKNDSQQSNSKFYVDCNDVDTTVTFPLKLVSTIDDQNGSAIVSDAVSDQIKRQMNFPMVPWPRPLQVQSFFSSLPMDTDFASRNEKQLLNADINGNPFSRSPRPSSLASFVSTTLLDYNNSSLVSETKNRKNKRLRHSVNKGVLSESIAGHRGEEDIDTLLQYINSSDKKGKSSVKGNSQNQVIPNKSNVFHENDKRKTFGKDIKNCHKNMINVVKKKLSRSNSLENLISNRNMTNEDVTNVFSFETKSVSNIDARIKDTKDDHLETPCNKNLDINSNVETPFTNNIEKIKDATSTDESIGHSSMGQSSPEVSSFAADFYSTADVSSQTMEESGFLIVKKKQRKKHQGKRSESYRWRTTQTQRKKGMMLPLAESKCGKQDSRRKSTSSVPHSEHSSADNSDLDSVHSLPVRGSVPHPTQPHPHTTPSSSSSTPQASYADIARMPISKLNSPSPCIITYSAQTSAIKQQTSESDSRRVEGSNVKRRLIDSRESTPVVSKGNSRISVPDKENEYSICCEVKVRSFAKSTREINTQTEPENANVTEMLNTEISTLKTYKKIDDPMRNLCNACLCSLKKNCSCLKSHITCARPKFKNTDIPPVIMDNMPPESNTCNVSFGFGIEEVLQMTPTKTVPPQSGPEPKDNLQISSTESALNNKNSESTEKCSSMSEAIGINNKTTSAMDSLTSKISHCVDVTSKANHSPDLSQEQSSHLRTVCYGTGRNICYSETKVNSKKFNLSELANYLGSEFQCIEKEVEGISKSNGISSRVVYYVDSSEEA